MNTQAGSGVKVYIENAALKLALPSKYKFDELPSATAKAKYLRDVADQLALESQRRGVRSLNVFLVLGTLAILLLSTVGSLSVLNWMQEFVLYSMYLLFLLASYLYYLSFSKDKLHRTKQSTDMREIIHIEDPPFSKQEMHLRFRTVAESMRILTGVWSCGFTDFRVSEEVPKLKVGLAWLRSLLQEWEQDFVLVNSSLNQEIIEYDLWITGQRDYFKKRVREEENLQQKFTWIMNSLIVLIGISSIVWLWNRHDVFNWMTNACSAFFGLTIAYREMRTIHHHLPEYKVMLSIYETAIEEASKTNKEKVLELGKLAMQELADWYQDRSTHRISPLTSS
jgi:hypothetical protein